MASDEVPQGQRGDSGRPPAICPSSGIVSERGFVLVAALRWFEHRRVASRTGGTTVHSRMTRIGGLVVTKAVV